MGDWSEEEKQLFLRVCAKARLWWMLFLIEVRNRLPRNTDAGISGACSRVTFLIGWGTNVQITIDRSSSLRVSLWTRTIGLPVMGAQST